MMMRPDMSKCIRYDNSEGLPSGYTVFISGASGDPVKDFPKFFDAEDSLLSAGHSVYNPARAYGGLSADGAVTNALTLAETTGLSWLTRTKLSLAGLLQCDSIALLPDWYDDRGSEIEQSLAASLGYTLVDWRSGNVIAERKSAGQIQAEWQQGQDERARKGGSYVEH